VYSNKADEFIALPKNMNHVRLNYIKFMVHLAKSTMLQDIIDQINPNNGVTVEKEIDNLYSYILRSNYGLN